MANTALLILRCSIAKRSSLEGRRAGTPGPQTAKSAKPQPSDLAPSLPDQRHAVKDIIPILSKQLRNDLLPERRQRNGAIVYRCAEKACLKDFTVTTKSVMESSHIALHKWLQGFYQMSSSKKGVSSHQLHRSLGITYKAAWFMTHRIREAMRAGGLVPMGGEGKIVEADETYYGRVDKANVRTKTTAGRPFTKSGKTANKRPIVAQVERGGSVRTFHVAVANQETVGKIVAENVARESRLFTDEAASIRPSAQTSPRTAP